MSIPTLDVIGIGNALVDVLSRCEDDFLTREQIDKGAMTLIDEARALGLYDHMGPATEISGGSAANTIAGLALLGGKGGFIGKVAGDQLGDVFAHDLKSLGVQFQTERLTQGPATGRCLVLVTPDAQRSMSTYLGAAVELSPADIDGSEIAKAQVIYMEGYLFDPPHAQQAFYEAAQAAHDAGRQVSLSLSDAFCVERYRPEFRHLIETEVDILFANEGELKALYQTDDFDTALTSVARDAKIAAVTRSEKGSVVVAGAEQYHVAAEPVAQVIDTTGAGDQYAAGFLMGFTRGKDLASCAALGSLAAAEVISHMGARPEKNLKAEAEARGLL
ncbi:MAG: adenosine kinase [Alphaproteobacteria bacterium]|nr:MAG: adenosine kinase [Alphaproteobacteria bacterium]